MHSLLEGISEDIFYPFTNWSSLIELSKIKILAVFRETKGSSISTVDLQDGESVNKMSKQDDMKLLLKIKIEGKGESPY